MYICMNELGGHPYFLIKFFFYYNKSRSNLKVRLTTAIVHISQKLTNYGDNTSLISLPASFLMIFRGNSYIEAKYRQSTV